jgi:nitric oxide dioxygenase
MYVAPLVLRTRTIMTSPTDSATSLPGSQLTATQVELIQQTLTLALKRLPNFGEVFYQHLFRINRDFRRLFQGESNHQQRMFTAMLMLIIEDWEHSMADMIQIHDLGRRHRGYGVRPEHFGDFEEALLVTLAEALGPDFTPSVGQVWRAAFRDLARVMQSGPHPE